MTFPRLLALLAIVLFGTIGMAAWWKGEKRQQPAKMPQKEKTDFAYLPIELKPETEIRPVIAEPSSAAYPSAPLPSPSLGHAERTKGEQGASPAPRQTAPLPDANRIEELFNIKDPKLPIVDTITYKSRVAWLKGRPAWLSDYASHYATSRHFIARSLNGKPDYFSQDLAEGDRFNVLHPDKTLSFYLLIDTSRSRMWFYVLDEESQQRTLLKTYQVGLGRMDSTKASGMLTPLGKYSLGNKIVIYKPKITGVYNGKKTEMIRIFGTRWLPFDKEIANCTASAAGFGIHGVPWIPDEQGELVENIGSLGKYESDGCIRLATVDIEELFAIVITRPTTVELVKDFYEAKLPGSELDVIARP